MAMNVQTQKCLNYPKICYIGLSLIVFYLFCCIISDCITYTVSTVTTVSTVSKKLDWRTFLRIVLDRISTKRMTACADLMGHHRFYTKPIDIFPAFFLFRKTAPSVLSFYNILRLNGTYKQYLLKCAIFLISFSGGKIQ